MHKNQSGFSVLVVLVALMLIILIALTSWYVLQNKGSGSLFHKDEVTVEITNTSQEYPKDQYVSIKLTVRNNSGQAQDFPWGNCAEKVDYFVDGKQKNISSGATCLIGYPPFEKGQTEKRTERYDPSGLSPGEHIIQLDVNKVKSNKLTINITDGKRSIDNCYEYTKDLTPLCKNVLIHTNIGDADQSLNDQRCLRIKQRFITNTPLRPIPSLSTINCDKGAEAYFVANMPPADLDGWRDKLRQVGYDAEIFTEETTIIFPKL